MDTKANAACGDEQQEANTQKGQGHHYLGMQGKCMHEAALSRACALCKRLDLGIWAFKTLLFSKGADKG